MYTNTNSRGGIVSLPLTDHRHNARVGLNNARISFNTLKLIVPYRRNGSFHAIETIRFILMEPNVSINRNHALPYSQK